MWTSQGIAGVIDRHPHRLRTDPSVLRTARPRTEFVRPLTVPSASAHRTCTSVRRTQASVARTKAVRGADETRPCDGPESPSGGPESPWGGRASPACGRKLAPVAAMCRFSSICLAGPSRHVAARRPMRQHECNVPATRLSRARARRRMLQLAFNVPAAVDLRRALMRSASGTRGKMRGANHVRSTHE